MTGAKAFVVLTAIFIMTDHSWATNALSCSQKRFQQLLYETPTRIMLDRNQAGCDYWAHVKREKETARKLNELSFNYNLYQVH